jgi:hypothetical protein
MLANDYLPIPKFAGLHPNALLRLQIFHPEQFVGKATVELSMQPQDIR